MTAERNTQVPVWHENEAFWKAMAPLFFDADHWAAAPAEAAHAARWLKMEPGAAVLDLGCGTGRHAVELARSGFHVTGVDRTGCILDEAKTRAAAEKMSVRFILADMRTWCEPGQFDGAINLSTSFGYFENPDDDGRVLRNLVESLKPGASLVMELIGKETAARDFTAHRAYDGPGGMHVEEDQKITRNGSWYEKRRVVESSGHKAVFDVAHRLFSADDIRALLLDNGFSSVHIYGNLAGAPYDAKAKALVAVANKS